MVIISVNWVCQLSYDFPSTFIPDQYPPVQTKTFAIVLSIIPPYTFIVMHTYTQSYGSPFLIQILFNDGNKTRFHRY